jgi:hypothetical protein
MIVEVLAADETRPLDRTELRALDEKGWIVVKSGPGPELRALLRGVRSQGLHVATHNDGGMYAVLVAKQRIRGLRSACQKISGSGEWQRPITIKTLSIRF